MPSLADGLSSLLAALDKLEIPYAVGGSLASSSYGLYRTTNDGDLVADIPPDRIEELAAELQSEFYADAAMMRNALSRGRAFNVIHYASAYKFDVFPLPRDEYSRTAFARRTYRTLPTPDEPVECAVATPEDTILAKLDWFRRGGETSQQQWADVRGIVQVSGPQLDLEYMRRWAEYLKVGDLLERLLAE